MRFLIWKFGEFGEDSQIKSSPIWFIACMLMAPRIQIVKLKNSPIPTESQFAKFNAHQIFPLYGMTMIESMQPSRTII